MELDEEIYRTALEDLETGVYLVDRERRILFWNDGAEKITGYLRQDVIGRSCFDNLLMHCDESNVILCGQGCPLAGTMHDGTRRESDVFLLHKNGERVPVRARATPIRDAGGAIIGAVESFDERVLRPGADVHPNPHAFNDSKDDATGVLDEISLQSHLAATLEDLCVDRVPFGVLSLSVDGLDEFRRTRGRIATESMLRAVARTILKSIGPSDAVGRRGEELFVAIVTGCPAVALETVASMLQRIVGQASIAWWGDRLSITISVGGTAARDVDTVDVLLDRSEKALRMGLTRDGNTVVL